MKSSYLATMRGLYEHRSRNAGEVVGPAAAGLVPGRVPEGAAFRLAPAVMDGAGMRFVDPRGIVCHVLHHGALSELGRNAALMFGTVIGKHAREE